MRSLKRLFRFVKGQYHLFFLSIIVVLIIQILGFITPLMVKSILDDHILGIEYEWVEIESKSDKAVFFQNHYYKQKRYLNENDITLGEKSIIIYKTNLYFIDDSVVKGSKTIEDSKLTIETKDDEVFTYDITKLSVQEVVLFYQPMTKSLIILIVFLFIKSLLTIIGTYIQHLSTGRVVSNIARRARTEAMRSIERLPISYFESEPAGKMASRITHDVDGLIVLYRQIVNVLFGAILSFVLAYIGMFYLDKRLALLSFIIYPIVIIWIRFFLKCLRRIAIKVNELRSLMTAKINEIINGISILKIFNFKKQTVSEFNQINQEFMNEQLKEVNLHVTFGWNMIGIIRGIITTFIVAYFGWQYLSFSGIVISAGLIYAYNEYLLKIIEPVSILFNQVGDFQHSLVRIDRIFKIIDGELEDDTKGPIERYRGKISFDNIWFAYEKEEYVLKGVSFEIEPGQLVGLVGHTGSGKSSLMNLLLRFYDIKDELSGIITIDGQDITTIPKRTYRTDIGIVLQEPFLFKGTIASNIRFGKDEISDQEIEAILISLGGEKIIKKFEKGIHQPITRTKDNMSSGEKQIISLARAVVFNPSILIMDEATSHIDTETEEMIKKALQVVSQNRTVIVIAHRLSTIYNADKIIVLDKGLKVEEGNHESLLEKNGIYAHMYYSQMANVELEILINDDKVA